MKLDRKVLSQFFYLGFEYHHNQEYLSAVENLINEISSDNSFLQYIRAYNSCVELLNDTLYYNDPSATLPRSRERLKELFDDCLNNFLSCLNKGQIEL